jgi:cation transport ATPase
MLYKDKTHDDTENEFPISLTRFYDTENRDDSEEETLELARQVKRLTEHPAGSGIIFYFAEGREDNPEGILQSVKEWRAANGKPGFKPELPDH